jgi:hypothetical protein
LKEEQERLREQQQFANILPLQSKFSKSSLPFPSPIYSSFSSKKSFLISKFERAFEAIFLKKRL